MNRSWMFVVLLAAALTAGCRDQSPPPPVPPPQTAVTNAPAAQTVAGAIGDMVTEQYKIEAGKQAKAKIEAASAAHDKDLQAVLNNQ